MSYIIEELRDSSMYEASRFPKYGSPLHLASRRVIDAEEALRAVLPENARGLHDKLEIAHSELGDRIEEDSFCAGFRTGVKLMTEVFCTDDT